MDELFANSGDPENVVSDLGLHCLQISLIHCRNLYQTAFCFFFVLFFRENKMLFHMNCLLGR